MGPCMLVFMYGDETTSAECRPTMREKRASKCVRSVVTTTTIPQETSQPPRLDTDLASHVHALEPRARHEVPPGVVDGQGIPCQDTQAQEEEERPLRGDAGGAVLLVCDRGIVFGVGWLAETGPRWVGWANYVPQREGRERDERDGGQAGERYVRLQGPVCGG